MVCDPGPALTFLMGLGDLLQGRSAEYMEDEHLFIGLLQSQDSPADGLELFLLQIICLRCSGGGKRQLLHWLVVEPFFPAALLQPGVFADLAQPGVQAAAALKPVDVQQRLKKGLLEQLLGLCFIAGQRQQKAIDGFAVFFVDGLKSGHGQPSFRRE